MIFIVMLWLAAGLLAASAAFFSIYGLTKLFTASVLSIIIMGSGMEFGKLITASFLFRFNKKINSFFKIYLTIALLVLMTITSLGIFGYLSASYQQDSLPLTQISQTLKFDKTEYNDLIKRQNQINNQISNLPADYVTSRERLIKTFGPEYKSNQIKIAKLQKEINQLQTKSIKTTSSIGPIIYVADILNLSPDKTIFYFILLIMSVFDPLAVALTIAANVAYLDYKKQKDEIAKPEDVAEEIIFNHPENLANQEKNDATLVAENNLLSEKLKNITY